MYFCLEMRGLFVARQLQVALAAAASTARERRALS
jgi:hypothetical protein